MLEMRNWGLKKVFAHGHTTMAETLPKPHCSGLLPPLSGPGPSAAPALTGFFQFSDVPSSFLPQGP